MKLKNIFIFLALISIIIMSIPQIYSLFIGQHDWYDIIQPGVQVPCLKCHSDIKQQLNTAEVMNFDCSTCHINDANPNPNPNPNDHHGNVVKPRCLNCHSYIATKLSNDAHRFFIAGANLSSQHKDENEACISCHTKKNLNIGFTFLDVYKLSVIRDSSGVWQVSGRKMFESGIVHNALYNDPNKVSTGQHVFVRGVNIRCEKCHADIRSQLNTSVHFRKACRECHLKSPENTTVHAAAVPRCLDCHQYIFDNPSIPNNINRPIEAHMPIIDYSIEKGITNSDVKNIACSSCHSTFANNLEFTRPEYLEWDVVANAEKNWTIENLVLGPNKVVSVKKKMDDKLHSITRNINCPACHQDIRDAALGGGHANEQWQKKHDIREYNSQIIYCRSCHKPIVDSANAANYENHGGMKISCLDCHTKNIRVDIRRDGNLRDPPWDSDKMGFIENSILKQNKELHRYLCMACKNSDVPKPEPGKPLHFKIYTDPDVRVFLNGVQTYPR